MRSTARQSCKQRLCEPPSLSPPGRALRVPSPRSRKPSIRHAGHHRHPGHPPALPERGGPHSGCRCPGAHNQRHQGILRADRLSRRRLGLTQGRGAASSHPLTAASDVGEASAVVSVPPLYGFRRFADAGSETLLRRAPAPPRFASINSTPASSSARRTARSFAAIIEV
jgi:hypothetical protein